MYENLKITDLDSTLAPPATSLAATNGYIAIAGVFTDLYGTIRRPDGTWTDGAVQIVQSKPHRLVQRKGGKQQAQSPLRSFPQVEASAAAATAETREEG